MRILITRQGDGTYVSSLEPHLLLESLSFAADVSQGRTALQLVQVRRLLEPQATGLAASLLTQEDLQELREILDGPGPPPPGRSSSPTTSPSTSGSSKPSATRCCRCS